ncbi:MAG: hypothetical protein ACRDRK_00765 [Pseudonocardia sp.]
MSIRKHICFVVACDDCRTGFDESQDYLVHFDTADDAMTYIAEHGWIINTDGHTRCPRCWVLVICDQFGHDWGPWIPCHCKGLIPVHVATGCDLYRLCRRHGCTDQQISTFANLPTIDEPIVPGC